MEPPLWLSCLPLEQDALKKLGKPGRRTDPTFSPSLLAWHASPSIHGVMGKQAALPLLPIGSSSGQPSTHSSQTRQEHFGHPNTSQTVGHGFLEEEEGGTKLPNTSQHAYHPSFCGTDRTNRHWNISFPPQVLWDKTRTRQDRPSPLTRPERTGAEPGSMPARQAGRPFKNPSPDPNSPNPSCLPNLI